MIKNAQHKFSKNYYKREKRNLTFWDTPMVLMYMNMQKYQKIVFFIKK